MRNAKMQEVTMEIAVGSFVLFTFMIIALFAIFISQNNIFKKTYDYEVTFPHVSGLVKGNAVHYRGIPSGQVKAMEVVKDGEGVNVNISMEFPIKLHDDYDISIQTASALGGKWLVIEEGNLALPEIDSYENLTGKAPVDIIEEATALVRELRNNLTEGEFLDNIKATVANVKDVTDNIKSITAKVDRGEGTLAKLINDKTVYGDLEAITANLRSVTAALTSTNSTIGKLLYEDDTLVDDLTKASANLAAFSKTLNEGEGTVSKLLNDDQLYEEVLDLVTEARATLDDLRETSPITTFSSIFFGAF